jgi:hypothetical protein
MNFAKRLLMVAGAVALAGILGAQLAPKAAHGIVATLVQVVNTAANPVPTQAVDNHARHALGLDASVVIPDGQLGVFGTFGDANGPYTVPAGKRLVMESLSAQFNLPTGHSPRISCS